MEASFFLDIICGTCLKEKITWKAINIINRGLAFFLFCVQYEMLQCENIQINTASTVNADKKINIVSVQEISKIAQAVQYKISHFYVYVSFAPSEEL